MYTNTNVEFDKLEKLKVCEVKMTLFLIIFEFECEARKVGVKKGNKWRKRLKFVASILDFIAFHV